MKAMLCVRLAALSMAACALVFATAPNLGSAADRPTAAFARPSGCSVSAGETLVRTFVRRYNRGDVAGAARLWAPEPYFQWFSADPPAARLGASSYNRATLTSYFRSRAQAGEQLRITELRAGFDPQRNIINFSGKLIRSAAGSVPSPRHDFKGAARCTGTSPVLIVWSM